MSIFGLDVSGTWEEKNVDMYIRIDSITFDWVEQILLRANNSEEVENIYFVYSVEDIKTVNDKMGLQKKVYQLAKKFKTIRFMLKELEKELIDLRVGQTKILINFGKDYVQDKYVNRIEQLHEDYRLSARENSRLFFIDYGVKDNKTAVNLAFNMDKGFLIGNYEELEKTEYTIKQEIEVKTMLSLVINDILTHRRLKVSFLSVDEGELIKESLKQLEFDNIMESGIYIRNGATDVVDRLMDLVVLDGFIIEGQSAEEERAVNLQLKHITNALKGVLKYHDNKELEEVLQKLHESIQSGALVGKEHKSKWLMVLTKIYTNYLGGGFADVG